MTAPSSSERYKISVTEKFIEIRGFLTIEEAFDFLNFYERKGYTCIGPTLEPNNCFCLYKTDFTKEYIPKEKDQIKEENVFESFFIESQKELEEKQRENMQLKKELRFFQEKYGIILSTTTPVIHD